MTVEYYSAMKKKVQVYVTIGQKKGENGITGNSKVPKCDSWVEI